MTSRNWVLIVVGAKILWEEEGFQFGFKHWQSWAVSKVLWVWIPNVGSEAREGVKATSCAFALLDFSACGCQKKGVVYEMECRHVAVQRGKQDRNHLQHWNTCKQLHYILNMFWNGKPVQFFQERCWVVVAGCQKNEFCSKILNYMERLDDRIRCTHEETVAVVKPWEDI